jgi:hypothetical protein
VPVPVVAAPIVVATGRQSVTVRRSQCDRPAESHYFLRQNGKLGGFKHHRLRPVRMTSDSGLSTLHSEHQIGCTHGTVPDSVPTRCTIEHSR